MILLALVLAIAALAQVAPAQISTSRLQLRLNFTGAGQTVSDSSGNGNDCRLGSAAGSDANDPTRVTEGVQFDGGDFVDCLRTSFGGTSLFAQASEKFTIQVVGLQPADATSMFLARSTGSSSVVELGSLSGSGVRATLRGTSTTIQDPTLTNEWHLWTVRWDGSTATARMDHGDDVSLASGAVANNSENLALGVRSISTGGSNFLPDGSKIALVLVYDRALSNAEMRTQYCGIRDYAGEKSVALPNANCPSADTTILSGSTFLGAPLRAASIGFTTAAEPGQSLQITSDTGSYTIPAASPFTSLGSRRIECRLDVSNLDCSSNATLWQFGDFALACLSSAATSLSLRRSSAYGTLEAMGRGDVFVRAQYDDSGELGTADSTWLEMWNADGSDYARAARSVSGGAEDVSGSNTVGGGRSFDVAWCRIYDTLVPLGSGPIATTGFNTPARTNRALPKNSVSDSPLGEWDFDGSLEDVSANEMDVSITGTAFIPTPSMDPIAVVEKVGQPLWQLDPVCRAGAACQLSAARSVSSHRSDDSLSYAWSLQGGPATAFFDADNIEQVSFECPVFGDYTVRLQVTDENARSATIDKHVGCVATDDQGVVVYPTEGSVRAEDVRLILGDRLMFGLSPWPAIDKIYIDMAEFYGSQQTTADVRYGDHWNRALASTIDVTNGSSVITCSDSNCHFQADFCGGDANPGSNARLVAWPSAGGRKEYNIVNSGGCVSDTELTLAVAYNGPTESGLNYAAWGDADMTTPSCLGCWVGDSDNNNYYDNVLAFYGLYYTSGLTKYRDYARSLAAVWWTMPRLDEGNCTTNCVGAKEKGISGLFLYMLESGVDISAGLEQECDSHNATLDTSDIREDGFRLVVKGLCAALHPNATKRAVWASEIDAALDTGSGRWGANQVASGIGQGAYLNTFFGDNGGGDLVNVTNGSTTVTYTAGSCTVCAPDNYVTFRPNGSDRGDVTVAYRIGSYSHPTLNLVTPYQGTTQTGWQPHANNLVGKGVQPWMSMPGIGLSVAHELGNGDALGQLLPYLQFTYSKGVNANSRGFYYARVTPQCEDGDGGLQPDAPDVNNTRCEGGLPPLSEVDRRDQRFVAAETFKLFGLGLHYSRGVDATLYGNLLAAGDDLLAAAFTAFENLGGPGTNDGITVLEMSEASTSALVKPKDFGFAFGFSNPYLFLAERIGGRGSEDLTDYEVPFNLAGTPGAVDVAVTLTQPKRSQTDTSVCTSSPCVLTGDARQGDHLATVVYRDSMMQPLATEAFMVSAAE